MPLVESTTADGSLAPHPDSSPHSRMRTSSRTPLLRLTLFYGATKVGVPQPLVYSSPTDSHALSRRDGLLLLPPISKRGWRHLRTSSHSPKLRAAQKPVLIQRSSKQRLLEMRQMRCEGPSSCLMVTWESIKMLLLTSLKQMRAHMPGARLMRTLLLSCSIAEARREELCRGKSRRHLQQRAHRGCMRPRHHEAKNVANRDRLSASCGRTLRVRREMKLRKRKSELNSHSFGWAPGASNLDPPSSFSNGTATLTSKNLRHEKCAMAFLASIKGKDQEHSLVDDHELQVIHRHGHRLTCSMTRRESWRVEHARHRSMWRRLQC
mmetsp:Transcript_8947/g.27382  ORF Transcript_8947/g.27382 Transcript_8947/m.27382 type:complete len:322 (+) Transcript_8947:156-1121(+)